MIQEEEDYSYEKKTMQEEKGEDNIYRKRRYKRRKVTFRKGRQSKGGSKVFWDILKKF